MPKQRKGESDEAYRKRENARKRKAYRRRQAALERPKPQAVTPSSVLVQGGRTDAVERIHVSAEPVMELYNRIGQVLTESRTAKKTAELLALSRAFSSVAVGLKTLQATATHEEVRAIVALVTPSLDEPTRKRLAQLLQAIDGRSGLR